MSGITNSLAKESGGGFYQRVINNYLSSISHGGITFEAHGKELFFGDAAHDLQVNIRVISNEFYKQIFWHGGIGFAEGYILGLWQTDDLTKLLQFLALNLHMVDSVDNSGWNTIPRLFYKIMHFFNRDNLSNAKRNIAQHYDLGNDFFSLFLDPYLMYSAAKFLDANESLEQASRNKLQLICEKLQLKPSDHLLEIGTGWGSMAIFAAQNYGCRVTTTTISTQQYKYTVNKIKQLGLQDQITVLLQDYRELTGSYDKLVSIEMIEHVGHQYLNTYLQVCSKLLKSTGIFVLQSITIPDQRYVAARNGVDFIKKYIFPGGCLPATGEIMRHTRTHTDFNVADIEDLTLDYARTLRAWRENLMQNKQHILSLGFDEVFIRKWLYYLCYCEAGFLERNIGDVQIVFTKPGYRSI